MIGHLSTDMDDLGQAFDLGQTGTYSFTGLINDQTYYVRLQGMNDTAAGPISQPEAVTPKADPDAPSGWVLINNGAESTPTPDVMLYISSSDIPPEGAIQGANAHQTDRLSLALNEVSAAVEMKISNDPTLADAVWEPLAAQKPWTLDCAGGRLCLVYAQFRDGAGNESLVVFDEILMEVVYLPLMLK
jgi:hypothetical protein